MTSDSELKKVIKVWEESGRSATATGRVLGMAESTVRRRIKLADRRGLLKSKSANKHGKKRKSNGLSRGEFQSQFDVDTKIREAIESALLLLTDDDIVKDADFRKECCGIGSASVWRQIADEKPFRDYQFVCDRKVWWATKASVKWVLQTIAKAGRLP